ncbi:MAG: methionine--tRNA ligase [Proteobacteria bacterium]|nr:methionine--tRNA ligase [Pseudomonadota bacterium]
MSEAKRFYVTSPIYYVNDKPHIGHAYTSLACDALARFMRLDGREVMFLTGTDEHGQKVEKAATAAGEAPQEFVDRISEPFRGLSKLLAFTNDDFIRTTEPRHKTSVQQLWRELVARDQIYLGTYAGWYSVRDEAFHAESELVDGKAPSGAPVEWVEEPSYFFRLSAWRDRLLAFYDENPDFVLPGSRRNEVVSFVKGGLDDLSVSRTSFKWGVPVPDDPDHVMYVWIDALTNYLTGVGYPDTGGAGYRRFWPADVHIVGKDILRFHAVYWPAFLMAADLPPPRRVFAHGWWTNEGQKISKSLGNIIDTSALVERYGVDQVRYFLLREVPFGNDGDFSHRAMVSRANNDLANDYGNLVQRVLSMINRYCGAAVPAPAANDGCHVDPSVLDAVGSLRHAHGLLRKVRPLMQRQAFHSALERIWLVVKEANVNVDHLAPWVLRKSDPERMKEVLYALAEVIRHLAITSQPFMPESTARILDQLAVPEDQRTFAHLNPGNRVTDEYSLAPGTPLPKPEGVFPRYVEHGAEAAR